MNPNSSKVWLPVVEKYAASPKTITVPIAHPLLWCGLMSMDEPPEKRKRERAPTELRGDGSMFDMIASHANDQLLKMPSQEEEDAEAEAFMRTAPLAFREIGYPAFIRTDLSSAKHSGPGVYRVDREEEIRKRVCDTIEDNEMKGLFPSAILVRQFLELDAKFTAFDGFPVAREWRLFADASGVKCLHPYWPADALVEHGPPDGWEEVLKDHHTVPSAMDELCAIAVRVVTELGGEWSIDFSCDKSGKWWLTDMALASQSYHWPGCKNS